MGIDMTLLTSCAGITTTAVTSVASFWDSPDACVPMWQVVPCDEIAIVVMFARKEQGSVLIQPPTEPENLLVTRDAYRARVHSARRFRVIPISFYRLSKSGRTVFKYRTPQSLYELWGANEADSNHIMTVRLGDVDRTVSVEVPPHKMVEKGGRNLFGRRPLEGKTFARMATKAGQTVRGVLVAKAEYMIRTTARNFRCNATNRIAGLKGVVNPTQRVDVLLVKLKGDFPAMIASIGIQQAKDICFLRGIDDLEEVSVDVVSESVSTGGDATAFEPLTYGRYISDTTISKVAKSGSVMIGLNKVGEDGFGNKARFGHCRVGA